MHYANSKPKKLSTILFVKHLVGIFIKIVHVYAENELKYDRKSTKFSWIGPAKVLANLILFGIKWFKLFIDSGVKEWWRIVININASSL